MRIKVIRCSNDMGTDDSETVTADIARERIDRDETVMILEATAAEMGRILPAWKGQYRRPVHTGSGWLFKMGVA